MSTPRLIAVHKAFPKELFRVNNGPLVKLRVWNPERHQYDIHASHGRVQAKASDPSTYMAPNGASMRPNSAYQQSLVSWRFKGANALIYAVPKGTQLPSDLLLVHERSDHYSLQPATEMTVEDLNHKISTFFIEKATAFTREDWLRAYPKSTETS